MGRPRRPGITGVMAVSACLSLNAVACNNSELARSPDAAPPGPNQFAASNGESSDPRGRTVHLGDVFPDAAASGVSRDGKRLMHTFDVVNPHARPITLGPVRKTCTCTDATLCDTVLGPFGRTALNVAVNTTGKAGAISAVCAVENDAGPPWTYTITANVHKTIAFGDTVTHFGSLSPDTQTQRVLPLTLSAPSEHLLPVIQSVEASHPDIVCSPVELGAIDHVRDGLVTMKARVPVSITPSSYSSDACRLSVNYALPSEQADAPACPSTIQTVLRWRVESPFIVKPPRVLIKILPGTEFPIEIPVRVTATAGEKSFHNVVPAARHDWVVPTLALTPGGCVVTLRVSSAPSGKPLVSGEVIVPTARHDHPEIAIPYTVMRLHAVTHSSQLKHARTER